MNGFPRILTLGILVALALVPGCGTPGVADDPQNVELRTYSVPHGFENEVRSMLRSALGTDENRVGRASIGPAGKLVVVAPPGIQKGVEALVRELDELDAPPPTPVPVKLTYWMVVGKPLGSAELTQKTAGGFAVVGDGLDDLGLALEQIAGVQGAQEFALLERMQLSSAGDNWAHLGGRHARIDQRAATVQGNVVADIRISIKQYGLETQVKLKPDQFIVLGQSGYNGDPVGSLDPKQAELALYYVITSDME